MCTAICAGGSRHAAEPARTAVAEGQCRFRRLPGRCWRSRRCGCADGQLFHCSFLCMDTTSQELIAVESWLTGCTAHRAPCRRLSLGAAVMHRGHSTISGSGRTAADVRLRGSSRGARGHSDRSSQATPCGHFRMADRASRRPLPVHVLPALYAAPSQHVLLF